VTFVGDSKYQFILCFEIASNYLATEKYRTVASNVRRAV
jgi:hypothetical protein